MFLEIYLDSEVFSLSLSVLVKLKPVGLGWRLLFFLSSSILVLLLLLLLLFTCLKLVIACFVLWS